MTGLHHNTTHGDGSYLRGLAKEYIAWKSVIARCENPKHKSYHQYGGRGIRICDRWRRSYEAFLADMVRAPTKAHTLGRIDNNGNYEPGNVRWETISQQSRNRRTTRLVPSLDGTLKPIIDVAKELGITHQAVHGRIKRGWSPAAAGSYVGVKPPPPLKQFCIAGHPLTGKNVYVRKDGSGRLCTVCANQHRREKTKRLRDAKASNPSSPA